MLGKELLCTTSTSDHTEQWEEVKMEVSLLIIIVEVSF